MIYQKHESEMYFVLPLDSTFDIEQSDLYKSLSRGNGIKVCDFVYQQTQNKILLIEAKKSSPNPENPESKDKVSEYSHDIHLKMIHSLLLLLGVAGLRSYLYPTKPPTWIKNTLDPMTKIVPVLIIKNSHKDWLPPISDRLRKGLSGTRKAFNLEDLLVLNEEMARSNGFIT